MFGAIWRFLVYRVLGGRVLLAITVLSWLYHKVTGRRPATAPAPDRPPRGAGAQVVGGDLPVDQG